MKIARPFVLFLVSACGLYAAASPSVGARQSARQTARPQQTPTPRPTPATPDELNDVTTTRIVRVPVTVLDKKKQPVTGLTRNDFQVFEDKRPVTAFDFLGEVTELEKLPVYVGVLMDTSGSTAAKLGFEKEAAMNFLDTVTRTRKDQAAFVTFDDEVTLRQDFTKNLNDLRKAIEAVKKPGTQTALYDAIWQFCDEKMRGVGSPRRALVIITDGDDTYSRARIEDAIQMAQRTDTIIYAISTKGGFAGSAVPGVEAGTVKDVGDRELQRLADETGGLAFFTGDMLALERAFKRIGEDLRSQYLITYKPDPPFDGRYRRIEVKVTSGEGYKVTAKRGYTADKDMSRK
jgi:Ca-activated chloride channel family protein